MTVPTFLDESRLPPALCEDEALRVVETCRRREAAICTEILMLASRRAQLKVEMENKCRALQICREDLSRAAGIALKLRPDGWIDWPAEENRDG